MMTPENFSRRDLLKTVAGLSGLVLGFHVGLRPFSFASAATTETFAPNVYLSIEENGDVTIVAHRSEMGTGIRTGLPMVLADELEADWSRVKVVQAQGDPKYGDQNTDGSRSVRQFYQPMRVAGATARQMLETAAAKIWDAPVQECRAQNHVVAHSPTGRGLKFGDLVKVAETLPVPAVGQLRYKDPKQWRYVGKPVPIVDLKNIVRGAAVFGLWVWAIRSLFAG